MQCREMPAGIRIGNTITTASSVRPAEDKRAPTYARRKPITLARTSRRRRNHDQTVLQD